MTKVHLLLYFIDDESDTFIIILIDICTFIIILYRYENLRYRR